MKFYAVVAALTAAAGVSAQSPTVGAGAQPTDQCAAANIVQSCVESLMPKVEKCVGNDYECLCQGWKDLQGCWNNCPNDQQGVAAANSNVGSYCGAWSQTASKSTQSSTSSTSSSSSSSSSSFSSTFSTASASSGSSTGASSTPTAAAPSGSNSGSGASHPSKTTAAKPTQSTTTSTNGALGLSANGVLAAVGVIAALL